MLSTLPEAAFSTCHDTQVILANIARTIERTQTLSRDLSVQANLLVVQANLLVVAGKVERPPKPAVSGINLLDMAEGLIAAHKAAKEDDDGRTLDLIEDALFHVGRRLQRECHGVVPNR